MTKTIHICLCFFIVSIKFQNYNLLPHDIEICIKLKFIKV
jgi:hypothetical protein